MRLSPFFFFLSLVSSSLIDTFEDWAHQFKMNFENDKHYETILENWINNHKFIDETNSKNLTYKLGHNQFSGMDSTEFRKYLGISKFLFNEHKPVTNNISYNYFMTQLPKSVNWLEKGAVTNVKDQGQCGSCWSFSTTGALEGAYFIKTGKLEAFSEQQLVDCDNRLNGGKDLGCKGGLMDNAFSWISKNNGLCKEDNYPYISGTTQKIDNCDKTCHVEPKSNIQTYIDVPPNSDDEMMKAISSQPVSIAIQADQREFQLYSSGVFTGKCGNELNHGVLVVGYGTLNDEDYYLVKNSWSDSWGDSGYIKLGRGIQYNNGDGQCGLLLQGSYPLL